MTDDQHCPDCGTVLDAWPYTYWCGACERTVSFAEAIGHIDGDPPED
jgi:ribosomal protein S27AE